jgi:hypothetical protein
MAHLESLTIVFGVTGGEGTHLSAGGCDGARIFEGER